MEQMSKFNLEEISATVCLNIEMVGRRQADCRSGAGVGIPGRTPGVH